MSEPKDPTNQSAKTELAKAAKKPYLKPSLQRLGTVQELTHTTLSNGK